MRLNVIALVVFCTLVCGLADRSHAAAETDRGWAVSWGGAYFEEALEVCLDADGNVYVAGGETPVSDAVGSEDTRGRADARTDAFLRKFDRDGNLQWIRRWGGEGYDKAYGLAVDADGNAYVSGNFEYTVDFDPGEGIERRAAHWSARRESDSFLSKFDCQGDLQWVRTWGGDSADSCRGAAIDALGNVYVTGAVSSGAIEFDLGSGTRGFTTDNDKFGFILSFDSSGLHRWTRYWGPVAESGSVDSLDVTAQLPGAVLIAGYFGKSIDFCPRLVEGRSSEIRESEGIDAFLVEYTTEGDFNWVRTWHGGMATFARGVCVDASGNIYVSGQASQGFDFDPGPDCRCFPNCENRGFLSKFDSDGQFLWVRENPCEDVRWGKAVATDIWGNIYLTGDFSTTVDFNPGPEVDERSPKGGFDACVCKLDSNGLYQWALTWGTDRRAKSSGHGIATDSQGNVYVVGDFEGSIYLGGESEGVFRTPDGKDDAFLVKLGPEGKF